MSVQKNIIPSNQFNLIDRRGLNKNLRIKLTLILLVSTCLPTFIVGILFVTQAEGSDVPLILVNAIGLPITFLLIGALLIWHYLSPLNELYKSAQVLLKGELSHRININTQDEIGFIAQTLNQTTDHIIQLMQHQSYERDLASAERNRVMTILSSIIDGIVVLDLNQKVVMINKSAENLTGYASAEVTGKYFEEIIELTDTNNQKISLRPYLLNSFNGEPSSKVPVTATLKSRKGRSAEVRLTVAHVGEEIVKGDLGVILVLHDVLAEKMLEQMQIDFVSMASHEVRTPLTSIINYLSTLSEETHETLNKEQYEFLQRAMESAKQLSALVDNLLNVSKVERGSLSVSLKPLDWRNQLTKLVQDNQGQAVRKNLKLILKLPDENIPMVMADPVRINEVVNNLISNAVEYTKEGGRIEVGVRLSGNEVLTYVADTGMGIPEAAIPHLFNKFFRVPGSLEQMNKGSGLGLYISKSIVDLHHGKIWVESKFGEGATFSFTLPYAPVTASPTIAKLTHINL